MCKLAAARSLPALWRRILRAQHTIRVLLTQRDPQNATCVCDATHTIIPVTCHTDFIRENVTDGQSSVDHVYTSFAASRIFIGTHQYTPGERVHITSKGIRIVAPNVKRPAERVILDIQTAEVVKIVSCFKVPQTLIFIYVLNSCGAYVRESLEMSRTIHDNCEWRRLAFRIVWNSD